VNEFEAGASPYGALNMVGNVWELVEQLSTPADNALKYFAIRLEPSPTRDEPWYTIRGQSFNEALDDGAVWDSTTVPLRWKDANIGFRCVKDPAPGQQ
jgi:formylglycine-generating enzyme required for sulfatase activity